jgi:Icc-related predicted phosphoesterase
MECSGDCFGALGDIHGDFESARRIMARHPDVPFWLSVGDVADADGRYEAMPAPLHFIKGNNEGFDALAAGAPAGNLVFIPNARPADIGGVRVAGLGGTFAPTWYDTPAAGLPHPVKRSVKATVLADKRRHFVREEVEACRALERIDVCLTHEAPRPFKVGRLEAGKAPINEVLAAMRPRLHLFGHHHRFAEQQYEGVSSVGLDLVSVSYLLIDRVTLRYEVRTT